MGVSLDDREGGEPCKSAETAQQCLARRPARALTLADRKHDGAEARSGEGGAPEVEPLPARLLLVDGYDLDDGGREYDCQRQIDVEDHPPVAELGEQSADEDADRGTRASDCSP